nr:unnamed protein product [Callosobruchus chinensis]
MHFDDAIDSTTHEERKPEMVTFYNMTKGGVDVLDQLCHNYDVSRSTRRWPMVLFYDLLNITAVNAFCIYRHHCAVINKNPKRAEFLEALSWELIKPQIERRSKLACIPAEIRRRARILLEIPEEPAPEKEKNGSRGLAGFWSTRHLYWFTDLMLFWSLEMVSPVSATVASSANIVTLPLGMLSGR